MLTMTIDAIRSKSEFMVNPAIKEIPAIIERYKKNRSADSEEMLKIIEDYYQQMVALDLIFKNLIEFTEKIRTEVNKE